VFESRPERGESSQRKAPVSGDPSWCDERSTFFASQPDLSGEPLSYFLGEKGGLLEGMEQEACPEAQIPKKEGKGPPFSLPFWVLVGFLGLDWLLGYWVAVHGFARKGIAVSAKLLF
jgi:hypothetical protein